LSGGRFFGLDDQREQQRGATTIFNYLNQAFKADEYFYASHEPHQQSATASCLLSKLRSSRSRFSPWEDFNILFGRQIIGALTSVAGVERFLSTESDFETRIFPSFSRTSVVDAR